MKRQKCSLCGCRSPQDHVETGWHIYQDIRLAEDFVVCTPCMVNAIKSAAQNPVREQTVEESRARRLLGDEAEMKAQEHNNDGVRGLQAETETDSLTASEALYGFIGWLTSRSERTVMSSNDDAACITDLVAKFCKANKLEEPRPWLYTRMVHPE